MRAIPDRARAADVACRAPETDANTLGDAYRVTRALSEALASPLSAEDQGVQSMPDASPAKWHLAHTTWFFEAFLLTPFLRHWRPYDPRWGFLFNSYYEAVGARHPRPQRGLLTRPSVEEIAGYRATVDQAMADLLAGPARASAEVAALVRLGINHEQQHQELLLTDILHAFSCNPLRPAYRSPPLPAAMGRRLQQPRPAGWVSYQGGLREVGHAGRGFAFDNESPRHTVFLRPFRLAGRPVRNADWLALHRRGRLPRPEHLSDGWAAAQAEGWRAPLYWQPDGAGGWLTMTLRGVRALDAEAPVCHVSFYEADAFARWAGKRLPTEGGGESPPRARLSPAIFSIWRSELSPLQPRPASSAGASDPPRQLFGDVWEWTQSAYAPYPGFRPAAGAVGEYNEKPGFMCNQMVLRGGSCATPAGHVRATYRNSSIPAAVAVQRAAPRRGRLKWISLPMTAFSTWSRTPSPTSSRRPERPRQATEDDPQPVLLRRRRMRGCSTTSARCPSIRRGRRSRHPAPQPRPPSPPRCRRERCWSSMAAAPASRYGCCWTPLSSRPPTFRSTFRGSICNRQRSCVRLSALAVMPNVDLTRSLALPPIAGRASHRLLPGLDHRQLPPADATQLLRFRRRSGLPAAC
ncbi:MAG: ergothioneine biosynthesis protein EgtB [Rhodospirillales bacterium]